MNSIKKWITGVLIVVLLLTSLTSCSLSKNISSETTDTPEKLTLSFRHFWILKHDNAVENIMTDVIKQFEEKYPHVKVEFEGLDQTFHREQKLKSEMVTGNPPDIFALFGGAEIEPYVNAQRLLDLKPFLEKNNLLKEFKNLDLWSFNDGVYGLPLEGFAEPLFYNKSIFRHLNISPPHTIPELIHAVNRLRLHGYIPFAFGNEERWQGAIYYQYMLHRFAGPEMIKDIAEGKGSFVNEEYLEATDAFIYLIKSGAFPLDSNNQSRDQAIKLFTDEKAAMYLNGNWDINLLKKDDVTFTSKIGVISFPSVLSGVEGSDQLAGGYTLGLGISASLNEAKKEAALNLMRMIYTSEVQTRLVYEALRVPSMNIQYDTVETGPIFAKLTELMEQTEQTFIPYDNILPPEVKQTFLKIVEDLIKLETTAEEALIELQTASETYWESIHRNDPRE